MTVRHLMAELESLQLFVVGIGRSGTSLLQSMLNAHQEISFTPEFGFIRRFLVSHTLERMWKRNPSVVRDVLVSDNLLCRLGFSREEIGEILDTVGLNFSARALYLELKRRFAEKQGAYTVRWFGDKDPRCIEYLALLAKLFPQARVLHVVRDPRDVLASKKKALWSKNRSALRHIFANRVQMKMGTRQGVRLFGSRYMECFYENLIADAPRVLGRICEFLEVDYDEAMLDFNRSSKVLVSESEMEWKKQTFGPLLKNNRDKWRNELSPWEVSLTQRMCREVMKLGTYTPHQVSDLSLTDRLSITGASMLMSAADPLFQLCRRLSYPQ